MDYVYVLQDGNDEVSDVFESEKAATERFCRIAQTELVQEAKEWTEAIRKELTKKRKRSSRDWPLSATPRQVAKLNDLIATARKTHKENDWLAVYDYVALTSDLDCMLPQRKYLEKFKVRKEQAQRDFLY